jgi:hypothetical protein
MTVTERNGKTVVVSDQLLSPRPSVNEQPMVGAGQAAPGDSHRDVSKPPEPDVLPDVPASSAQPDTNTGRTLGQIVIVLVVLLVLVNIPINHHGASLAQIIPKATAIVIYDGMLLKGSNSEIYIMDDHQLRWVSSPEAFDYYFDHHEVHIVEDNLLESFGKGKPIRRLVTCLNSPYIYAVENGEKRWVRDPPTGNKARTWDEVGLISCDSLRRLPDSLPVPENAGAQP